MLLAAAVAFGPRELLAPVIAGCILFPRGFCPTVCQGHAHTAHPTKPISISACHLPVPTVCRLQTDLCCDHSGHRWSRLGDSKTIPWPHPRAAYRSDEWLADRFPRLSGLLLRHLGIPSRCPRWCTLSDNLELTHCYISIPKRQLALLPDLCFPEFHSVHRSGYRNSPLTQRKQSCGL